MRFEALMVLNMEFTVFYTLSETSLEAVSSSVNDTQNYWVLFSMYDENHIHHTRDLVEHTGSLS
jgi:hypothetical protein